MVNFQNEAITIPGEDSPSNTNAAVQNQATPNSFGVEPTDIAQTNSQTQTPTTERSATPNNSQFNAWWLIVPVAFGMAWWLLRNRWGSSSKNTNTIQRETKGRANSTSRSSLSNRGKKDSTKGIDTQLSKLGVDGQPAAQNAPGISKRIKKRKETETVAPTVSKKQRKLQRKMEEDRNRSSALSSDLNRKPSAHGHETVQSHSNSNSSFAESTVRDGQESTSYSNGSVDILDVDTVSFVPASTSNQSTRFVNATHMNARVSSQKKGVQRSQQEKREKPVVAGFTKYERSNEKIRTVVPQSSPEATRVVRTVEEQAISSEKTNSNNEIMAEPGGSSTPPTAAPRTLKDFIRK